MKTKRLRLKRWASTVIYVSLVGIVFVSMVFISNKLENNYGGTNLSYILKDFINNDMEDSISSTAWGNGFRISVGYDFAYGRKNVFAPALGVYYRCIPRGSDFWDNVLAAYISFSF